MDENNSINISEKNNRITALIQELDNKNHIAILTKDYGLFLESKIVDFNSELYAKELYIKKIESKLKNNENCIKSYKNEIKENHLEIQYLKKNSFFKKIFGPLSYLFLILKSKPKELYLNFKLYSALKNSEYFDIGYYLNNNVDILNSGWCNYFSPELHYVCNGFDEKREFNKKFFNINSKKELLNYIKNYE